MSEATPLLSPRPADPANSWLSRARRALPASLSVRRPRVLLATAAVAVIGLVLLATVGRGDGPSFHRPLDDAISEPNLREHLVRFEAIAAKNNNSRSVAGRKGYLDSVEYIYSQLKAKTDYNVTKQYFSFPMFVSGPGSNLSFSGDSTNQDLILDRDFAPLRNSGPGVISKAPLAVVSTGCAAADYAKVASGAVVLLAREPGIGAPPDCLYRQKISLAVAAKAVAVLLYTNTPGDSGPAYGRWPPDAKAVPAFGISQSLALTLLQRLALNSSASIAVSLFSNVSYANVETINVLAETLTGDPSNVVIAGSHLDSVPAGPGINDDASGSSATLEIALALHRSGLSKKVVNKVRFAWWSAEELGLIGSTYYVDDLAAHNPEELAKIACNLNNDMIASPNGARFIYDGRNAVDPKLKKPSGVIQSDFQEFYNAKGLAHEPTPFDGRSDYGEFLKFGIPAGGLFAGAEEIKTEEQAAAYGGTAGVAFDPCYHLSCDTLENIEGLGMKIFVELAKGIAHVVQKLAFEKDLRGHLWN
ncbi:hypothetical protein HDU83_003791 [Entophlyctis luteolus]|nr:hypothetical protein HDU83_003791 [Entophlyctis luteolus]KAJ3391870.1 hypothetical protein HDU84_005221 [Entophlyctis sp. JEL0112]